LPLKTLTGMLELERKSAAAAKVLQVFGFVPNFLLQPFLLSRKRPLVFVVLSSCSCLFAKQRQQTFRGKNFTTCSTCKGTRFKQAAMRCPSMPVNPPQPMFNALSTINFKGIAESETRFKQCAKLAFEPADESVPSAPKFSERPCAKWSANKVSAFVLILACCVERARAGDESGSGGRRAGWLGGGGGGRLERLHADGAA
jgi:hypothetical protein